MRTVFFSLLFVLGACSPQFKGFIVQDTFSVRSSASQVEVTFLGTSSFLISTPRASVLIDGYISRECHNLFGKIEPNVARIAEVLNEIGVALPNVSMGELNLGERGRHLDAIIPLHGHYDHAMDVGVVAGLTGGVVYGDAFVRQIVETSEARFDWMFDRRLADQFVAIDVEGGTAERLVFGDITITLFETPHSENFLSRSIDAFGDADGWAFPARISSMKQGASMAAHVAIGDQAFIIFPTAGALDGQVEQFGLTAETVFLGVGGLGWQSADTIGRFMGETVIASHAQRVFPIHWDNHQQPLEDGLSVPFYERLDPVLRQAMELAEVEVRPIQALHPFNPFE